MSELYCACGYWNLGPVVELDRDSLQLRNPRCGAPGCYCKRTPRELKLGAVAIAAALQLRRDFPVPGDPMTCKPDLSQLDQLEGPAGEQAWTRVRHAIQHHRAAKRLLALGTVTRTIDVPARTPDPFERPRRFGLHQALVVVGGIAAVLAVVWLYWLLAYAAEGLRW